MQDFQEELYKNLSSTNKKVTIFLKVVLELWVKLLV